jgi:hypothetical protein
MAAKNGIENARKQTFAAKNCTELSYRITVPKDAFDMKGFAEAIGPVVKSRGWNSTAVRQPRNPNLADYHLHVFWKPEGNKRKLQVDFHAWMSESEEKHGEPFAENFFDWAGQFFSSGTVSAHIHGEFEYPIEKWQSKIIALPIKVPFEGKTAEIEGISVKLPAEPHGIHDLWISRSKKTLDLQLYADRQIVFKNFTPHGDVDAFVSVAMSVITEQKP